MSEIWNFEELMDLYSREGKENHLVSGKWGLEKEALRVTPEGNLALTPHPVEFGNKITNVSVTTDFSESQVEVITPVLSSIEASYARLLELQSYVQQVIGKELLWPLSMPGLLPDDSDIPLARYDGSEDGRKREIYRTGLAHRYGKQMQMISGIHYNFSFGDLFWQPLVERYNGNKITRAFQDQTYFDTATNFIRYRWLVIFLFGSSPIGTDNYRNAFFKLNNNACQDFIQEYKSVNHMTESVSMRMSRFGYENAFQNTITISLNSLPDYIADLRKVLNTRSAVYENLGVFKDGQQIQLNDNLLQSENEYYSSLRFKQIRSPDETMLDALERKGILYLELRTFDLDPFESAGISREAIYFTHVFLLFCLFEESQKITNQHVAIFGLNAHRTALYGRKKNLNLVTDDGQETALVSWAEKVFEKLFKIARLLDKTNDAERYETAVKAQALKLSRIDLLPSSKIIEAMVSKNMNHEQFGLVLAKAHKPSTR